MRKLIRLFQVLLLTLIWGTASAQAPYCNPAYSTGCTYGDGLTLFQLGTINQPIPCTGTPSYYHDYTAQSTDMSLGTDYTLTVQSGYSSTYVDVWIDLDNNNAFDAGEVVVNDLVCASSGTNYTATINLPAGTATGPHRLRVRTNWLSAVADPCASYSYGNAADFTVNVVGGGGPTAPVTVTIGTGTLTTNYPYTTYWHDGRTQLLITKDEIVAAGGFAGNIGNLQLNVSSFNSSLQVLNGFEIKMKHTTSTSLSGFSSGGWTVVYSGTELPNATGWNNKDFPVPFFWNGTDNLLVEICYDNTSYTSYSYVYATTATGKAWYYYTDGSSGCSMSGGSAGASRPNTKFTITPLISSTLEGVVTNAITGLPIIGALVSVDDSSTYTNLDGSYMLNCYGGDVNISCGKLGYNTEVVATTLVAGANTQDFALFDNTAPPSVVYASLNGAQTAADITWGLPMSGYVIIYDDGEADNMVSWASAGNINAVKFTPIEQYPVTITGGSVYIGDGSYPVGGNVLTPFEIAVFDDDGTLGYPNTELARFEVIPTNYYWVHFELPTPVTITSGKFYIGMVQGGAYPNCAPIGVDEDPPLQMVSYSKYVAGNGPWVPAGYNDFMIRAEAYGSGGPLDVASASSPIMIEKTRIHPASKFLNQPKVAGGFEGLPSYIPMDKAKSMQSAQIAPTQASSNLALVTPAPGSVENCDQPFTGVIPFTGIIPASAADGILYDNGPMVNSPGTGLSGMDESVIVTPINSYGFNYNQALGYTVAEDFTVTGSDPWAIASVDVFGYQTGMVYNAASTFTGAYIRVWDGNPSLPGSTVVWGDLTTNRLASSTFTNVFRTNAIGASTGAAGQSRPIFKNTINTAGLTLDPGSYWIEFTTTGSLASGPWVPPVTIDATPASGNALQWTGTAWQPIMSGTTYQQGLPFVLNGNVLGDLEYEVFRLKQGEENNQPVWTSLGIVPATSTTDPAWATLANGAYRWAVKAHYAGDRWSEPALSNVLGKGWESNVTINVTLSSLAGIPSGVNITMINTLVPDTIYYALTPASGTVVFPTVWKGNYDISLVKFGYTTILENVDITNNTHVFNYLLMETQWAPYNLYVDDRTLVAVWNAPNPMVALFEEHFTTSSYATNGWTVNGGNWGIGAGNPTPGAVFNWSPQVTNYEQTITTPDIVGVGSPGLLLKYDIYLSNFGTTNENQMAVELWDGATWNRLKNYTNLNGDIPWTSETLNIAAYTWDTFKIRFNAYGTDTYDINNWNIDNVVVAATLGDKSLLGYDVYLDDIQIAYTTDTTYLLPASVCIYGRTYTAAVDAVYESGTSDRDYYTFTAHFLPPPVDLTATQLQDAAYLDWEGAEWPGKKVWIDNSSSSNFAIANEVDVNAAAHTPGATDAVFDLQFNYDAAAVSGAAGNAGAESDGNFLYTTRWGSNLIHKYNLDGTLVEEFSIPGVTGLRDLAYDGQYFYGGAAATTIFQMDFTTKTLVSTITSPTAVRAIAFDDAQDGFWVNNWATNLTLVSMTGATLNTLPTAPPSMYGAAYDSWTSGGPFLWVFSGTTTGSGCQVEQISLATGTLTGVMHSVSGDLGATIAGGLFTQGGIVPGFVTLGGLAQGDGATDRLFGYELAAGGGGGGGAAGEIGYNVYRDGMLIAYVEAPTTEYYDLYLNPAEYCYTVTAVYDLEPFGFAPGTTDESLEEGPACVNVQYGAPIPWMEDWNSTNFSYNNWMFEPAQGHWRISNAMGNDVPSAEFNWAAPEADYSYAMVSQALDASIFDCSVIKLDFDLKLDDRNQTGAEMLTVDVYWDGMWHKVAEYKNEGSFDWETKSIDISTVAKKAFKVRFVAHGANTSDIIAWFVDNVNAYPVPNAASNLTGTQAVGPDAVATLTWNAPECATGPVGDLLKLSQHDGNPANGYYQSYGMAYGVVYDLTAYPDATLAKIDFHHASWGVTGVWQYNIHVVDWTTYAEIASIGPLVTTGNDIWENNIMLGDIMGYGGGQVGIMLEPLSNNPTDAYPDFSADNVGPDGVSMYGTLPDFSGFAASGIGDFLQNLWIYTAFGDGKVMVAPKVQVSQLQQQATARVATGAVMNRAFLTLNQKAINYTPTEGGNRGVVGYNVYRRYSTETEWTLLNATPLTDTTYTDNLPEFGEFCYVVKAVHAAFNNSTIESPESNEHCGWMIVGQQELNAQSISVYPNPATDKLTVKTTSEITRVELVNYLGQVVRNQQVSGSGVYTLNVSELESGVYFVKFYAADGQAGMERVTITR